MLKERVETVMNFHDGEFIAAKGRSASTGGLRLIPLNVRDGGGGGGGAGRLSVVVKKASWGATPLCSTPGVGAEGDNPF